MKEEKKEAKQKTSKMKKTSFVSGIIRSKLKIIIILLIIIGLIIFFYPKPSEYGCGKEVIGCTCLGIEVEKDTLVEKLDNCIVSNDCCGLPIRCKVIARSTIP